MNTRIFFLLGTLLFGMGMLFMGIQVFLPGINVRTFEDYNEIIFHK